MTWTAINRVRAWPAARWSAAVAAGLVALALMPGRADAQFQLGLQDPGLEMRGTAAQVQTAYAAMQATKGSVVRVAVFWANVVPGGSSAPVGFRPSDPSDPHYRWTGLDRAVRAAAQHHLRILLVFLDAPSWAQGPGPRRPYVSPGAWDPDPTEFAAFIHAVAVRYGGNYPDPLNAGAKLPRVNYWEPWNEPNIPGYFSAPDPVGAYRTLLDRAYGVIKAVHRDNVIVLGGLAPVSPVPGSIPALNFGADLLCLHRVGAGFRAAHRCRHRAEFDVFGVHPYSFAATPTKHAYKRGDVLVGDLPEVSALVGAANRLHTAAPRIHHRIWVTEFTWLTNPPDSQLGDSDSVAARYVAYSMYEMWRSGVSLVVWQTALDEPGDTPTGGGLYSNSGQPKLTLQAFAFPLVASVRNRRGYAWGRAPVSRRTTIRLQRLVRGSWLTVAGVRTGSDGVFEARFRAHGNGTYRALVPGKLASLGYNSRPIPPRRTHAFPSG